MKAHNNNEAQNDRDIDLVVLKRRSLNHFYDALRTGRVVAFTGSYANLQYGYPSWKALIETHFDNITDELKDREKRPLDDPIFTQLKILKAKTLDDSNALTADYGIGLAEVLAKFDRYSDNGNYKTIRTKTLEMFRLTDIPNFDKLPNIYSILFDQLHIKRFMTLNYDLELEWHGFVDDHEKVQGKSRDEIWNGPKPNNPPKGGIAKEATRKGDLTTTFNRYMPGSGRITSQILIRKHSETLFEFGLWSPDNETRILHMHGRQDRWDRMLLSRRDYRDLYWRRGYTRLPFERGLQSIFGGNSVLFIGIGLGEADVMRTLEQFMSDNPSRIKSPHFVLWNSELKTNKETGAYEIDTHKNDMFRLEVYQKFGIHVLFDAELADLLGMSAAVYNKCIRLKAYGSLKARKDAWLTQEQSIEKEASEQNKKYKARQESFVHNKEYKALQKAWRLQQSLEKLHEFTDALWRIETWNWKMFRSMQDKYEKLDSSKSVQRNKKLIQIWGVEGFSEHRMQATNAIKHFHRRKTRKSTTLLNDCHPLILVPMAPGTGKGRIAAALADYFSNEGKIPTILINAEFANETDSIFGALSGAGAKSVAQERERSRNESFENVFGRYNPKKTIQDERFVVIFNGMERFIGESGKPLCNEFDSVIRKAVRHFDAREDDQTSHLIFLGTSRMMRYLSTLTGNITTVDVKKPSDDKTKAKNTKPPKFTKNVLTFENTKRKVKALKLDITWKDGRQNYFGEIITAHAKIIPKQNFKLISPPDRLVLTEQRRVFFRQILSTDYFKQILSEYDIDPSLPLVILRTLASVGQPVPRSVLMRCSEVRRFLENGSPGIGQKFVNVLKVLADRKLIIPMEKLETQPSHDRRYGLHNSMLAELRERYGIPLTDSKLACSFNLSIYAAQSSDGYIPEPEWHIRLGQLADDLTGAYSMNDLLRDSVNGPLRGGQPAFEPPQTFDLQEARKKIKKYGFIHYEDDEIYNMLLPECAASLRAALSLMRNYYSTAALLMHSNHDIDPFLEKAPLTKHLLRLKRLIRVSRDIAIVRAYAKKCILSKEEKKTRTQQEASILAMGQEAFFPDDLVWLYNELGMVHLTQGKLYGAKFAFEEALKINDKFVECGEQLRNWRTISLNLVQLQIDRGLLEKARGTLQSLETSIEDHAMRFGNVDRSENSPSRGKRAREIIIERYARDPGGANYNRIDKEFPSDIMLSVALCLCYRGLIKLLMGAYAASVDNFEDGLQILKALGEQRAYSMFKKHYASVLGSLGREIESHTALRESVAAAGNTKQADLDHHARISIVRYGYKVKNLRESKSQSGPIPQLMQSLNYSSNSDMFRVQLEALQTLAWIHYLNDDYDSSIKYAADAIAVASKYGHGLRKVTLRILTAIILIRRGSRSSAINLLEQSSRIATKMRFDKAVEQVENIMVEISERN